MVVATVASVLAVLLIVGLLVWAIVNASRSADRANLRLMVQEDLLAEIEVQGERLEQQADTIRRLNVLLVGMGEDQLRLLDKIDVQTVTIEELVTEIETLQRDTLTEVGDLTFELVEVEPGRFETRVVTETEVVPGETEVIETPGEVVEVPGDPPPPGPEPPEPEPEPVVVPGRDCADMPPTSSRQHCR